ncbi:MAG: methyltransferase domain-containing protein [Chloroflexota bacterium]|nr:MAG: methyltransferase domain-containing protein [Chloroflexota bacterium]
MNHADHVRLLKRGIPGPGVWADFGSGRGAFTLALAELISPYGEIHSVDRDGKALARQRKSLTAQFPAVNLTTYEVDFTEPMALPQLDGLVVANALHYQPWKDDTVRRLRDYLRPGGHFLVVEYDTDRGNRWVPYPFSYNQWRIIASRCGLVQTELLASAPSSFLGSFYSAISRTSLQ